MARLYRASFLRPIYAARAGRQAGARTSRTIVVLSMLAWALSAQPVAARLPVESVAKVSLPAYDRAVLEIEDKQRDREGLPIRFAIANPTAIRPESDGTWEVVVDGTSLWRLRITSDGAASINLGFRRYHMPPGAQLTLGPSLLGGQTIGPFTDALNNARGQLWTPVVCGDDIVVTLTIPERVRDELELEIGSINVGYRPFSDPILLSGACNVDVACPEAEPWQDQVRSVGLLSVGGTLICSGAMLNNTANDLRPLFLTANHCGVTPGNAASVVVYWNFQNSTCRTPGSAASGAPGNGPLTMFQSGATLRASSAPSDFALLELDATPDASWDVTYAGWSRTFQAASSSAGIHHPGANEKRISIDNDPSTVTSYMQPTSPGDATHLRVADWDLGTTEAGSSGSPLFDQNHRVVGQLHGGFTACGNDDAIWYGRLAVSWNGEGTSDTRLSDWLDSLAMGSPAIDAVSSGGLSVVPGGDVFHIGKVGGPFTNSIVNYTLMNATSSPIDFEVSLTNSFGLLLDGGTANVSGTLLANGGSQMVQVSVGPDVNSLPAGTYTESIVFSDLSNALSRTRVHVVEVGRTLFSVTPTSGLHAGGPAGGPFPDTISYTVTNERPTPVQVAVASTDSWVSLNNGMAPITLNLSGVGESQMVNVGFSTAASDLPVGTYNASVSFTNQSGGDGSTQRDVTLDVGRIVRTSTDTPQPINDFATITSMINVPEARCIDDLNVDMDITHTYIGDLIIDLESPDGTIVRLHNGTGGSSDNIVVTYDDESFAPDGPGMLADFDGESTAGEWKLTITDTGFPDSGSLNHWALRFEPASASCPASQLIYSFPLNSDPGWVRQGLWGYGQPTGGGTHNRDPNSGHTGTKVFGYNLNGDYTNNMSTPQYLTTTAIDCSAFGRTRLKFRRWLGIDSASFDHASIQISTNGINWNDVWQHTMTTPVTETSWSLQSYDLSPVADGHSTVFLRWGMGPTNASNTYPGWNIDDIEIWGAPQPTTCNESVPLGTCCIAEAPTAEPAPIKHNRYISMVPSNVGRSTALRVKLISVHHPDPPNAPSNPAPDFSAYEGEVRWVGPPVEYVDSEIQGTHFVAAALQCVPHYADFGSLGQIYVYGTEIVPDSVYQAQAIVESCGGAVEPLISSPLELETARWGDVVAPFQLPSPAEVSQPNISDITAVVDKFRDRAGAVTKPRAQLQGNIVNPDVTVNIAEIAAAVDGFKGRAYPYSGPTGTCR